ncbi:MAG TPA: hypothetical protein VLL97_13555, partial [Acidobacteriota bacterium]|nr:hypothetical protein [Acidobacteriota bacterium]
LKQTLEQKGPGGEQLFSLTMDAIRHSLSVGLRSVFAIGAVMMIFSFIIICTIPRKIAAAEE